MTRKTRNINTEQYCGYVEKIGSQFSGQWKENALQVKDKKTGLGFRTNIRKVGKLGYVNDHNCWIHRNINSAIDYLLEVFAPRYTKGI